MKNTLFQKKTLKIIKIFSLLAAILLFLCEIYNIYFFINENNDLEKFWIDIENSIVIILLFILFHKPHKIELLACISFFYTVEIFVTSDTTNFIGLFMYFLSISILYVRGYFIRHKKFKIGVAVVILIGLILFSLKFGIFSFFHFVLECLAYILLSSLIIFFISINFEKEEVTETKILNLYDFKGLKETDVILLKLVQKNKLYKEIAGDTFRTEGTVRNRLNKIYHLLGVMDRMGFISLYSKHEIIYQEINANNQEQHSLYKKKK